MGKFSGYLIGSDYDGTFNRYNAGGIGRNVEVMKYFRDEGGIFAIATGRPYAGSYAPFMKEIFKGDLDYVVASNGANVIDRDGNFVTDNKNEVKYARELWERAIEVEGVGFMGFAYGVDFCPIPLNKDEGNKVWDDLCSRVEYFTQVNIGFPSIEIAEKFSAEVIRDFPTIFNPQRNGGTVDIPPAGITKASGLWDIAKLHNIPKENIYTSGDSYNDLSMIKAYHGYPVENAEQILKDEAEGIVPDVATIVEIIEKTRLNG